MWKTLKHNGCEYYYYPEDVMISDSGQKNVYAQDADGNEYTIVWGDDGLISEIIPM